MRAQEYLSIAYKSQERSIRYQSIVFGDPHVKSGTRAGILPGDSHSISFIYSFLGDIIPFFTRSAFVPRITIHLGMKHFHRANTTLRDMVRVAGHYDARQASHRAIL